MCSLLSRDDYTLTASLRNEKREIMLPLMPIIRAAAKQRHQRCYAAPGKGGMYLLKNESPSQQGPAATSDAVPFETVELSIVDILWEAEKPVELSDLSTELRRRLPSFKPNHYGCSRLLSLLTRKLKHRIDVTIHKEQNVTTASLRAETAQPAPATEASRSPQATPQEPHSLEDVKSTVSQLLAEAPENQLHLSDLATELTARLPGFRPNHYGCSKLMSLLSRKLNDAVVLRRDRKRNAVFATVKVPAEKTPPKSDVTVQSEKKQPAPKETKKAPTAAPAEKKPATPREAPKPQTKPAEKKEPEKAVEKPQPPVKTTTPQQTVDDDTVTLLGSFAAIRESQYRRLAEIALPEAWDFSGADAAPLGILKDYLRATYSRSRRQNVVRFDEKQNAAAFETGLLDHNSAPIFAYFARSERAVNPWELMDFCLAGQGLYGKLLLRNFDPLPKAASYYISPADLLYDTSLGVPQVDWNHVLVDKVARIPAEVLRRAGLDVPGSSLFIDEVSRLKECQKCLRSDPAIYRRLKATFEGAIDLTLKRLRYDFRLAVPIYRISEQNTALALPLCLTDEHTVDLALVVERFGAGYLGHTVYPLRWVYTSARVIFRPAVSWLDATTLPPTPALKDEGPSEMALPPEDVTPSAAPARPRRKGRASAQQAAQAAGSVETTATKRKRTTRQKNPPKSAATAPPLTVPPDETIENRNVMTSLLRFFRKS